MDFLEKSISFCLCWCLVYFRFATNPDPLEKLFFSGSYPTGVLGLSRSKGKSRESNLMESAP